MTDPNGNVVRSFGAGMFIWPGPIHEGHGEAALIIDGASAKSFVLRVLVSIGITAAAVLVSYVAVRWLIGVH